MQQNLRKGYDPLKNPFSPTQQYSMSFTEAVAAFMNKQIAELGALHQKRDAGIEGKLSADPRKQIWVDKWDYS
jgi:hypothetical protein